MIRRKTEHRGAARRRVPGVEGLESRQLMAAVVTAQYPGSIYGIVSAPDRNL